MARGTDYMKAIVNEPDATGWARLRAAIVAQAVRDTHSVLKGEGTQKPAELLHFWKSRWAGLLTDDADVDYLISELEDFI